MFTNSDFEVPCFIWKKEVYIVREHNYAIKAWASIRARMDHAPVLISLDHHTDCHVAFVWWVYQDRKFGLSTNSVEVHTALQEECSKVNRSNPDSVSLAAQRLKNDEHIDAAIKAGIIDHAYVINHQDSTGTRSNDVLDWDKEWEKVPYVFRAPAPEAKSYSLPKNRIFIIPSGCSVDCSQNPHDDTCLRPHSDQAIEANYLDAKFEILNAMAKGVGIGDIFALPYILDIDLDYFHTARSIKPDDSSIFYQLIRGAVAMTIALEPIYVRAERLEGEIIDSDWLLEQLKNHIHAATT